MDLLIYTRITFWNNSFSGNVVFKNFKCEKVCVSHSIYKIVHTDYRYRRKLIILSEKSIIKVILTQPIMPPSFLSDFLACSRALEGWLELVF